MRIRDWSSDVCSSDLQKGSRSRGHRRLKWAFHFDGLSSWLGFLAAIGMLVLEIVVRIPHEYAGVTLARSYETVGWSGRQLDRSEERRVGKGCVSLCRSRWSP